MEVSPNLSNDKLVAVVSNDALKSFAHYDRAATKTSQKKAKASWAAKIESICQRIDLLKILATAIANLLEYLKVVTNDDTKSILQPVIDSLEYTASITKMQLTRISKDADNTKAKKRASHSHAKLTKAARMKAVDQAAKERLQMTSQPKKILHSLVKEAKLAVAAIESNFVAEIPEQAESSYLAPRKKMGLEIEEDDAAFIIRLPRPANGESVYAPQESVNIMHTHLITANPKPSRLYITQSSKPWSTIKEFPFRELA